MRRLEKIIAHIQLRGCRKRAIAIRNDEIAVATAWPVFDPLCAVPHDIRSGFALRIGTPSTELQQQVPFVHGVDDAVAGSVVYDRVAGTGVVDIEIPAAI